MRSRGDSVVHIRLARLALAVVLAVGIPLAASGDALSSKPVIARLGPDALVLWDATTVVAQIVSDKATDADANVRLEHGALAALAETAPSLADAKTITVRVIYAKTGAVSPVYGAATFAGVERYATLEISGADARSDAGKWKEAAAAAGPAGLFPKSVTFTVTGVLPPR
jgi:hypothetical protein